MYINDCTKCCQWSEHERSCLTLEKRKNLNTQHVTFFFLGAPIEWAPIDIGQCALWTIWSVGISSVPADQLKWKKCDVGYNTNKEACCVWQFSLYLFLLMSFVCFCWVISDSIRAPCAAERSRFKYVKSYLCYYSTLLLYTACLHDSVDKR